MNLLPLAEKNLVKIEYRKKLALVSLSALMAVIFIGLVPITVSYIASAYEIANLKKQIDTVAKRNITGGIATNTEIIKNVNNKLNILTRKFPQTLDYDISSVFSSLATSTKIRIFSLSYDQVSIKKGETKEVGHRIILGGVAKDRDGLQKFIKALEQDKRFKSVDLPVSNLIESKDINFFITIMLNKK